MFRDYSHVCLKPYKTKTVTCKHFRTCTELKDFGTVTAVLQQVQGFWNVMSFLEITQRPRSLQSAATGLNHDIRIIENPAYKKIRQVMYV